MRSLVVGLADRSYRILIDAGLLGRADLIIAKLRSRRAVLISNEIVAPLYADQLTSGLADGGITVDRIVLPDGESTKNWESLNVIFESLLKIRAERSTTLIALGGGVVGDLVGFAAATYQRGAPFVQVPTTLLAQVDSSVGGKTGINHPLGKNMIGAFYQPQLVVADTTTLKSLPDRELRAGLAEVIKYGLIRDPAFFEWVELHIEDLLKRDMTALEYAVERSCLNKSEVVAEDETESGVRAFLNLGHTFGHAIETGLGYGRWLHGEAVAAGTVMALRLSQRLGWVSEGDAQRIQALFLKAGLPVRGPRLGAERYLALMASDKKVVDGKMRLVLLQGIGKACIYGDARPADIAVAIDDCCDD